jgi:hypothetical protein
MQAILCSGLGAVRRCHGCLSPEPEKVVDVTPAAMEVVEPSQHPDAHVPSPIEVEGAGEGNMGSAEPAPVNAEQPEENSIGRLH